MRLFSRRKPAQSDRYQYAISDQVRCRILHTLVGIAENRGYFPIDGFLQEMGSALCAKTGGLRDRAGSGNEDPVITHFRAANDEEALDFIELMFHLNSFQRAGLPDFAVPAFNDIFEEEGIGFELTPQRYVDTGEPGTINGRHTGHNSFRIEYPQIIRKDQRSTHEHTVKPALELLSDSRFSTANTELLQAFEKIKKGDYDDAITACGCAFESVMKTICNIKKWNYDPKDTCSKLVENCKSNGLFPSFYVESLKGIGSIRNNIGDAHGKGPTPALKATSAHAEHMVAVTCSHITFLMRQAGI